MLGGKVVGWENKRPVKIPDNKTGDCNLPSVCSSFKARHSEA